jgi:peptide/nickel transport system substrate-binding protein
VRQAINFALDRDTIVKDVLEGFGEARTGPFGPKQMGFNEAASKFYSYDPAKAKQLLKDAGYESGFDLKWMFAKGSYLNDQQIVETVIQNLKAVGIRMSLDQMEVNQLFAKQNDGDFMVGMIRWSRQYDTDTVIAGVSTQGGTQKWFKSDAIDQLIVKARETLDPTARTKVYQDLYQAMVDDPPYVYLHAQDQVWGKRAASNWNINVFSGNASLTLFY